jgi:hypothetical protein
MEFSLRKGSGANKMTGTDLVRPSCFPALSPWCNWEAISSQNWVNMAGRYENQTLGEAIRVEAWSLDQTCKMLIQNVNPAWKLSKLCNPTAGSRLPGFQGSSLPLRSSEPTKNGAPRCQTQRLKPNSHSCWDKPGLRWSKVIYLKFIHIQKISEISNILKSLKSKPIIIHQ